MIFLFEEKVNAAIVMNLSTGLLSFTFRLQ